MPKVSVLLTAYNRERYIGAAIESVLAQTFEDFELLVVDDRSSDATVEIARSYERLDRRMRLSVNPWNLGQFRNRNHAASLATGRYLKFHDSDDLMYPHCLATMVAGLDAEPRAGFALSGSSAWHGGPCPMLSTPRMSYQREFLGFGMFNGGPAAALFRSDVFRALGGFDDIGVPSDYTFWLKACAHHSVLLLPGDLFWYRVHDQQELQSPQAARQYAEVPGRAWAALVSRDCPLLGEELEQAKSNLAFSTAKQIYRHLRRAEWQLAAHRFRCSGLTMAEWVRYVRRPRRSALAGTPLTADGDYVMPEPTTVQVETRAR